MFPVPLVGCVLRDAQDPSNTRKLPTSPVTILLRAPAEGAFGQFVDGLLVKIAAYELFMRMGGQGREQFFFEVLRQHY